MSDDKKFNWTIWKYPLNFNADGNCNVELPKNSVVLSAQLQMSHICIWALVDPDEAETEIKKFRIVGTGTELGINPRTAAFKYYSTVQIPDNHAPNGSFVFHVFEVVDYERYEAPKDSEVELVLSFEENTQMD
jgi:hypothetical protein